MTTAKRSLAAILLLALAACSSIEITTSPVEPFAEGNYTYYKWRTDPLPQDTGSSDAYYALDPVMRRQLDAALGAKGYRLDAEKAQFSVDYVYATGLIQGIESEQASNISHIPSVNPTRQVDGASVDNAIALAGLKETSNILIQFNDGASNEEVWRAVLTKIVENANQVDTTDLDEKLGKAVTRALKELPDAQ
jgi:hypothetical protein